MKHARVSDLHQSLNNNCSDAIDEEKEIDTLFTNASSTDINPQETVSVQQLSSTATFSWMQFSRVTALPMNHKFGLLHWPCRKAHMLTSFSSGLSDDVSAFSSHSKRAQVKHIS